MLAVSAKIVTAPNAAILMMPPASNASMLPAPSASAPILDNLSEIFLIQSKDNKARLSAGETAVHSKTEERKQKIADAIEQIDKAIQEAEEAARHHSFWDSLGDVLGTVAKVAGVVASIAVAVCTFGAGTPLAVLAIAGAVLSTAAFADSELHILEKLGVDPEIAGWIDLGMSIGGAIATGGASFGGSVDTIERAAVLAAGLAGASAHVVRGIDAREQAAYQGRIEDDYANALSSQKRANRIQEQLLALLDELKEESKDGERRLSHVQGAIEAQDAASSAAVRA